jgi:hypothetical protein
MGLYGNVLVAPSDPDYWAPVHREVLLTLDDILIEDGKVAPFSRSETTHTAMGRFGNVLLVAGEPDLALTVRQGEVVRLYLTNTANTRVFKVRLTGARIKLVGGDSGRVEREQFVEDVVLAPSERAILDVLFDQSGQLTLEHITPDRTYPLAAITVTEDPVEPALGEQFEILLLALPADILLHRNVIGPGFDQTKASRRCDRSSDACRAGRVPTPTRPGTCARWVLREHRGGRIAPRALLQLPRHGVLARCKTATLFAKRL